MKNDSLSRSSETPGLYSWYVLGVLFVVYVFNFLDRQILAILAEDIKADLGISDSEIGFLFGTAFAVFYATLGVGLARLADLWDRRLLIAFGVGFWSIMTALSGVARGFLPLALCRFGVAIGEASATPAGFSMLYDYFPQKIRTTVLAIFTSGVYIGAGLGIFLGGWTVEAWNSAWPNSELAPFGLQGWQASFMIVGFPGVCIAIWVSTLKEPIRGRLDNIISKPHPKPFAEALSTLYVMIPIFNISILRKGGHKFLVTNITVFLTLILTVIYLIDVTDNSLQWAVLGVGIYAAISWIQGLSIKDSVVFGMIFKCRTIVLLIFSGGPMNLIGVAIPFWAIPYFQRQFDISVSDLGLIIGSGSAISGLCGMLLGGVFADRLRRNNPRGKLIVYLLGIIGATLFAIVFVTANVTWVAFGGLFLMMFSGAFSSSPLISIFNDLVLPRARATTSAFLAMSNTLIGVAMGPYIIGLLSDMYVSQGFSSGESLKNAMLWALCLPVLGITLAIIAFKYIKTDEESILERAKFYGEKFL